MQLIGFVLVVTTLKLAGLTYRPKSYVANAVSNT